jgi:peptidoglycan L-alanyl-D-glutamate endopeptidase CwlK
MDFRSEDFLALVHPILAYRARNIADALVAEGYDPRIDRGISTVAQQDALWAIGRDVDGHVIGTTVTNAKGTQSNHVMGFAVDFFFIVDGKADWESHGFDRLASLAPSYGLRSGAHWGDRPHVELEEFPTEPTEEMQQTYLQAGVQQVWKEFPIAT